MSVFQTPIKQASVELSVDSVQINNSVKFINLKRVQFSYRQLNKKQCHFSAIDSVDLSSVDIARCDSVIQFNLVRFLLMSCQVKSSHLYLYSAFNNTNCVKAAAQYQNRKIVYH